MVVTVVALQQFSRKDAAKHIFCFSSLYDRKISSCFSLERAELRSFTKTSRTLAGFVQGYTPATDEGN